MSEFKKKPQTKLLGPCYFKRNRLKQLENSFLCCFFTFLNYMGTPNGPKKVLKGPQVGGIYDPMFKIENKPQIKLLGPFF
jgi:hypothetical protein